MRVRTVRVLAVVAIVTAGMVTGGAASATPGPGTFTKITTPSGTTLFHFNGNPSATNHFTVSGSTSLDVTSVDIECVLNRADGPASVLSDTGVPVSGGAFSTVVNYTSPTGNCRLRAIPSGTPLTDYLGSYSGPIFYTSAFIPAFDTTPTKYGFVAVAEQGSGIAELEDAGRCGTALLATIETPGMDLRGPANQSCKLALPFGNITPSGTATASAIKVGGHNAYLPAGVNSFLIGSRGLSVTQPALTTSSSVTGNGDMTLTESALLMRCSVSDTYPPTAGSCPSLISTGVRFQRVTNIFRGTHQVRVRDTYTSTNGAAHTVGLEYQSQPAFPDTGAPGYIFPGHGNSFQKATPNENVTGLGTKAASMFMRSDIDASSDDPDADTTALSWSRAPSRVVFSSAVDVFAMRYLLTVPASGKLFIGFADSEAVPTSGAKVLALIADAEMMNAPSITAPANGATVHSKTTTVKGKLTAGANGLPTSVVVNGHSAHITRTSATTATYKVTFTESFGKHTIKATARDSAGNTTSKSITIHNQA